MFKTSNHVTGKGREGVEVSKEQLEEHTHIAVKKDEYKKLKEQAERVQELEEVVSELTKQNKELRESIKFYNSESYNAHLERLLDKRENKIHLLEQQNKRYCEALEFYADRDNYKPEHLDPETDEKWSKIDYDEGFNARKTLEKECTNGRYRQTNFR